VEQSVAKVMLALETIGYISKGGTGEDKAYSEEDEEKVKERLRGLGYIE
jgi:hypothetical protein